MKLADLLVYHYPFYQTARQKGVSDEGIIMHAIATIPDDVIELVSVYKEYGLFGIIGGIIGIGKTIYGAGKTIIGKFKKKYKVGLKVTPRAGTVPPAPAPPAPIPEPAGLPIWAWILIGVGVVGIILALVIPGKKGK